MSTAKFNLPFTLGISDKAPEGIDPKLRSFADEIYNAFQQIQLAIHNYLGVGQQIQELWSQLKYTETLHQASQTRFYCQASEDIAYGHAVNLFASGGVLVARNANATNNTKPAHGFCTVSTGVLANDYMEVVLFRGVIPGFTGLTLGARYFLSTTNGLVTTSAPGAAGNIEQALGIAVDTTALLYDFGLHFIQH